MSRGVDAFVRGAGTPASTGRRGRWLGPVLAFAALVVVVAVTVEPPVTETAYDPASAGITGLRGTLDVLRELGVDVVVTDDLAAAAGADTVLLPPLGWPDDVARELAADGARVVAEVPPTEDTPPSPLGVGGIGPVTLAPGAGCALLPDVGELRATSWQGFLLGADGEDPAPADGEDPAPAHGDACVVRGRTAWLVRTEVGAGELVSVGTLAPLVNARLADSDAALATVRLLAPTGTERVVVLDGPPGEGPPTLLDLVDPRWFDAAWLSLAALVVLALARGRRLGRPVGEELPVRVPSGELARALGDLRHRAGHDGRALGTLRDRTLGVARTRLGLAPDADVDAVLERLDAEGRPAAAEEAAALRGETDDLVAVAQALARLRASLTARVPDLDAPAHDPTT